jgi:diguanylate cyclase
MASQSGTFDVTPAPIEEVDVEYATSMARRAFALMAQHNVPPTPHNFEVWLTFARGTVPELKKIINILIANKRAFDAVTNSGLFETYVAGHTDGSSGEISGQLHKVLSSAKGFLTTAMTDSRNQVQALGGVATHLRDDADSRAIIQELVAELSKAATRATTLEAHFAAAAQELDKIRNNLAVVEHRSKTDALTGLANRLALEDFLRDSQMAAMETGQPLSLFLIDIDHFKSFNDEFGHQFGDQVLRLISKVLKDSVRAHDLAARFGGEELVGVLPGADLRVCMEVAERIRQTISTRQITRRATGEVLSKVTVSIGVAQFVPGEMLASLFERCDRALYAAKRGGRNRTVSELQLDGGIAAA